MEKLFIEGKKNTPKVILDSSQDIFEISGESRPENAAAFYDQILNWLDSYKNELINTTSNKGIELSMKLEYFNSSSAKFIMIIAQKLNEFIGKGIPASINWYFDEDDDGMKETGEDLASLSKIPINLIRL